jgi:hypothetical protein
MEVSPMKTIPFLVVLVALVAGSGLIPTCAQAAIDLSAPGMPGPNGVPNREVCWSQPYSSSATAVSSEYISATGLESRVANDFSVTTDYTTIQHVTWWGQYYNYSSNMPDATTFNLFWYTDPQMSCSPGELLCVYTIPNNAGETVVVAPAVFVYGADLNIDCCFDANALYWFVVQCGDHRSVPGAGQWGRKGAESIVLCESMIVSVYFGIPTWTPLSALGISDYDASQEFDCLTCGIVPTLKTTWGGIKALYR